MAPTPTPARLLHLLSLYFPSSQSFSSAFTRSSAGFPLLSPQPSHPSSAGSGLLFPHLSAVRARRGAVGLWVAPPLPHLPASCAAREGAGQLESASVCTGCRRAQRAGGAQLPAGHWAVDRSDEAETWRPRASEAAEPEPLAARAAPDDAAWLLTARGRRILAAVITLQSPWCIPPQCFRPCSSRCRPGLRALCLFIRHFPFPFLPPSQFAFPLPLCFAISPPPRYGRRRGAANGRPL